MKHRTWKRIAALAMALSLALACAACSGGAGGSASGSVSASGSAPAESAGQAEGQIVLTDQAGREVVLEGPAQSIVSCYYISTYAAIALGAEDRVVGLEKKADTRPIYQMAAPELLEKPQVGTMKELDVEATAALEPLVIMPQALADYADTLAQLGIPVLVVNPESHEALVEMLQLMGTALGLEDRAEALTSYYEEQLDRMAELTQDTEAPVVYMGSKPAFLATARLHVPSTLIRQAGGVNAGDSLEGSYWTEVSYEDVLAMAPQVIVLPAGAEYTVQDVLEDPQLSALPAVQDGAVYQMPGGIEEWDSPVPSGILGTMWMTSILHPDVYPFEELADAQDFYQTFYGFYFSGCLAHHQVRSCLCEKGESAMKKHGRDWAAAAACLLLVGGLGPSPSLWAAFPSLCLRSVPSSPGEWRGPWRPRCSGSFGSPGCAWGCWRAGLWGWRGACTRRCSATRWPPRPDRGGLGGLPGGGLRHRAGGRDPAGDHGGLLSHGDGRPGPGAPSGGGGPAGAPAAISWRGS